MSIVNGAEYNRLHTAGAGAFRYEFGDFVALAHFQNGRVYWRLYQNDTFVTGEDRPIADAPFTSFTIWAAVKAASKQATDRN